jgi:hypothetical protein
MKHLKKFEEENINENIDNDLIRPISNYFKDTHNSLVSLKNQLNYTNNKISNNENINSITKEIVRLLSEFDIVKEKFDKFKNKNIN